MSRVNSNSIGDNISLVSGPTGGTASASTDDMGSWYEAMSKAWGSVLDGQAEKITTMADAIGAGQDNPSSVALLTAESLKMQFLSSNAATSTNSVGQALESIARK